MGKTVYSVGEALREQEADQRRYCGKCELPKVICACAEARAYDRANKFRPGVPK